MRQFALHLGDALAVLRLLPSDHFHCVVTSPPYLWVRDYGVEGQLGQEPTVEAYVERLVTIMREVRRVLRPDGTLWLNLGDCYARIGGEVGGGNRELMHLDGVQRRATRLAPGLKEKDLVGTPWRVALALQADGWWLRSDIIWAKTNPMPESVTDRPTRAHEYVFLLAKSKTYYYDAVAIQEEAEVGWNLRESKPDYDGYQPDGQRVHQGFRDARRVGRSGNKARVMGHEVGATGIDRGRRSMLGRGVPWEGETRNKRSVWTIGTEPFKDAHFAVFPAALVMPCILAGTSERGCCPQCGAPWAREIEREFMPQADTTAAHGVRAAAGQKSMDVQSNWGGVARGTTRKRMIGWRPGCDCVQGGMHLSGDWIDPPTEPCRVLDPFAGAGTTLLVALRLGRAATGIELKPAYAEMARRRIMEDAPLLNRESS